MEQTGRMQVLWITAALLSSPLLTLCDPLNVLSAPNVLRVGNSENVFVEVQDYAGADVPVTITVKDHPQKYEQLETKSVVLSATNNYQALVSIKIPEKYALGKDPSEKQYVYLQAQFPNTNLEKVVMVSFQPGYIFIQTDKSIYSPGSAVYYRLFSLATDLQPYDHEGVLIDIKNPQGIIVKRELNFPKKGTLAEKYIIPDLASSGKWTIAASFRNTPQKNFTADFDVKEYVLPSFEVLLTPSKSFFYVYDQSLQVKISAKYLLGNNVEGSAFVVFGVTQGESKTSLPASLKKVPITKGEGRAELTREIIQTTFPFVEQLDGSSLYISVSVLTESGSEMVEAQRSGIQIVTSPYTIHFRRTPKFFKPGMPFDVMVQVLNPDQTPAENVDVVVNPGGQQVQTKENGIAKVTVSTQEGASSLLITAQTNHPDLIQKRQGVKQMTVQAYATQGGSNNYLHIGTDAAELKVGDSLKVNLNFDKSPRIQNQDFTYLILNNGQIVQANRFKRQDQTKVTLSIPITNKMLPSFRVVAYYHVGASEVVADSVWVDVKDTCLGTLRVEAKDAKADYKPGDRFSLRITGDSGAKVSLVAVNKGSFVLNKNRLTQSKIWDIIEKHDTGCTAGSGQDSMGVFYDAGLLFESDKAGGTTSRTTLDCPALSKRRRRALTVSQVIQTLTGKYGGGLKKCCSDGLRESKLGDTCERRATFISDGAECVQAFLHCCKEMQTREKESRDEVLHLARSEEIDIDDIISRTHFPESWLWEERVLPACQGDQCTSTLITDTFLKHTITSWQILAISLSNTHGICVADPYEITVKTDLFVDLKLPYSAVRKQQIEIKAILHNFSGKKQIVLVELLKADYICHAPSKKDQYKTTVTVEAGSTRSIPFTITPLELGDHQVEVKVKSSDDLTDGVRKVLKVVSKGVLSTVEVENIELNPSQVPGGVQLIKVKSDIPDKMIPDTPASVYVTASVQEGSQPNEQIISGDFMGLLIVKPTGDGEQTMILMTLPLIATHYLDTTRQWEAVGMDRRNEAINHILSGYSQELTYRKSDGSYAAQTDRPSSTWLTAYVAKVFTMAHNFISVPEDVICSTFKWLVMQTQLPDGMFKESAPVIHGEMVGDVRGKDADTSLTAFILIAMQEGSKICSPSVTSLTHSMNKATEYLERRIPTLTNPYAVAMTSYAMANAGKFNKDTLMKHSSGGGAYWQVSGGHHFSLEATAYALLALVKVKDMDAAGKVMHWLSRQISSYGSSGTTQATIMVFQAVAEYYKELNKFEQGAQLNLELSWSTQSRKYKRMFDRKTSEIMISETRVLKQELSVTATGNAVGSLKVRTVYYATPVQKESDCTTFDLAVKLEKQSYATYPGASQSYMFTIDIQYKNPGRESTLTVVDIGLLAGFVVDEKDLKDQSTGTGKSIQKFVIEKQLSDQGTLVLYLDKVSRSPNSNRLAFKVHKITEVAVFQPAAVTVYEYYSPDERCTKFYQPVKEYGTLEDTWCKGLVGLRGQIDEKCSIQKKEKSISAQERMDKACAHDYVYKIKVVSRELGLERDEYTMRIEQVLREGSDPIVEGKERKFLGHPTCKESLGFKEGKSYLVMGHSDDLGRIQDQMQYFLGQRTWIEYWPTVAEAQTQEYRERYMGITELYHTLTAFGCPN